MVIQLDAGWKSENLGWSYLLVESLMFLNSESGFLVISLMFLFVWSKLLMSKMSFMVMISLDEVEYVNIPHKCIMLFIFLECCILIDKILHAMSCYKL